VNTEKYFLIGQNLSQLFIFSSLHAAMQLASWVGACGSLWGNCVVLWVDPTHFWL